MPSLLQPPRSNQLVQWSHFTVGSLHCPLYACQFLLTTNQLPLYNLVLLLIMCSLALHHNRMLMLKICHLIPLLVLLLPYNKTLLHWLTWSLLVKIAKLLCQQPLKLIMPLLVSTITPWFLEPRVVSQSRKFLLLSKNQSVLMMPYNKRNGSKQCKRIFLLQFKIIHGLLCHNYLRAERQLRASGYSKSKKIPMGRLKNTKHFRWQKDSIRYQALILMKHLVQLLNDLQLESF